MDASSSEWSKEWHNFAFGRYTAELAVTYGSTNKLITAKTSFWVIPWMVTLAGLAVLVIALLLLKVLVQRYNAYIVQKYTQGRSSRK